jgi:hypothetical protein
MASGSILGTLWKNDQEVAVALLVKVLIMLYRGNASIENIMAELGVEQALAGDLLDAATQLNAGLTSGGSTIGPRTESSELPDFLE